MTVKLLVLYTQPEDAEAFDAHYLSVHAPLVEKLPGLLRWESGKAIGPADQGEATYHRIAELYFDDMPALGAAMGGEEGKATAADFQAIAPTGSRMFLVELD
jgi:uncharacterized protein (TIGR02118 family)